MVCFGFCFCVFIKDGIDKINFLKTGSENSGIENQKEGFLLEG